MEQILLEIVIFIVGFSLGWHAREVIALYIIKRSQEKIQQFHIEHILRTHLRYENETFYVYNSDNHAFLTQAKNKKEIVEFFKSTYPEKKVIMDQNDIELLEKHSS